MLIRRYSILKLLAALVIVTSFATIAQALSIGCIGHQCEGQMHSAKHAVEAMSSGDITTSITHHGPDSSGTGDCSPAFCQAVILLSQNREAEQDQLDIAPEFQFRAQAKLSEPDSPYRPPDL